MDSEVEGREEHDPEELNDPGNEDPGSLMDDATVPLIEEDEDETPEYPLPSPTDSLGRGELPPDE